MAHQTGITCVVDLKDALSKAVLDGSDVRCLVIAIDNESLVLSQLYTVKGDWRCQYSECVESRLVSGTACYIFYRLDSRNSHGFEWLYLNYIAEDASVKLKMLYSATSATLKSTFGAQHLANDGLLTGGSKDELSLEGYDRHVAAGKAPPPLTLQEEEKQMVLAMEKVEMGINDKHMTLSGLGFSPSNETTVALGKFQSGNIDFLEIFINLEGKEELRVGSEEPRMSGDVLHAHVPCDRPSYILFRYRHKFQGTDCQPIIFVYSTPGYKCPIRERMVYSSGKASFVQICEKLSIVLDRKLEVDSSSEVSEEALLQEVHPPTSDGRQKFDKPKGPGRNKQKK